MNTGKDKLERHIGLKFGDSAADMVFDADLEWSLLKPAVQKSNFLTWSPLRFNIYYLGAAVLLLIAVGILVFRSGAEDVSVKKDIPEIYKNVNPAETEKKSAELQVNTAEPAVKSAAGEVSSGASRKNLHPVSSAVADHPVAPVQGINPADTSGFRSSAAAGEPIVQDKNEPVPDANTDDEEDFFRRHSRRLKDSTGIKLFKNRK